MPEAYFRDQFSISVRSAIQLALENPSEQGVFGSALRMPEMEQTHDRESVQTFCREVAERFRNNFFVRRVSRGRLVDKSIENFYLLGCILLFFPNARIIDLQVRRPLYTTSVYGWKRVEDHLQPAISILGEAANYFPRPS